MTPVQPPHRRELPWLAAWFVVALSLPPEASVGLGGLRLSGYRILLIVAMFPAAYRTFARPTHPLLRCVDALMVFHGLWSMLALTLHPAAGGVESGGIYLVESTGAYLLARAYVRDAADLEAAARLSIVVLLLLLPFALVESVTGAHVLRDLAKAAFGGPSAHAMERRFGLTRAFASFDHPILFGMFSAMAFAFSVEGLPSRVRGHPWPVVRTGLVGLGVIASVSSGAFAAVAFVMALRGWTRLTRRVSGRWRVLLSIFATIWMFFVLGSPRSPVKVFVSYLTFSPGTGYARLEIFDYGFAEVRRHPLFGIGLGEWARPDWMASSSIDNFFLATAVRYGAPATLSLIAALMFVGFAVTHAPSRASTPALRRAVGFAIAGLALGGCTVHFWNSLLTLFCFLLGTAGAVVAGPRHAPARLIPTHVPAVPPRAFAT